MCVCVFVVLTAVPDEYILNISRVSEHKATDLVTIIMVWALFNTVLFLIDIVHHREFLLC